jgi:signal transduction histidine kinase
MQRPDARQVTTGGSRLGLLLVAASLVGAGAYHVLAFGGDPLRPAVAAATGVVLFLVVGYLIGSDVAPSNYPLVLGWTLLGTALVGGGALVLAAVTGPVPTLADDGPTLAALAGTGSVTGLAVGIQSARVRQANARAERARTIAQRLSEERGRFAVLNETTRSLLDAPDRETVARRLVEEGRVGLPGPFAGVWLYDPERDRLVPAQTTSTDADWKPRQLWADSEAMAAFERGEPLTIAGEEFPDVGPLFAAPIGDHGLLVVGSPEGFDERARNLAEVYALTAEAAMDRIERQAELRRQNDRLDSFASVVAHDLRNPLNVIRGRAELAQATGDPSHLDPIFRSLDRMETIIEDVLALARGGEADLDLEPVTLTDLVEASWTQVDTGSATLDVGVLPPTQADPDRLARLFENLFRNSVEHGGPDVTVTVAGLDDEDGFFVADDGPGIPVAEREKVLQEGYSTAEGTGIGLAVVRQVADAHGWRLAVTESDTGGARFEFRF